MITLPSFKGLLGKGGGFDPDYQAILNRGTALGYTLPDTITQAAGNNFVVTLKAAGIWSELDILYVFATTGDSNFATLNWKSPTLYQATLVNSPSFRSKAGFKGDGTTSYINTNFNPSTNGVKYTQNNASRAFYIVSPATSQNAALAFDGNSTASVNTCRNFSGVTHRINSLTNLTTNHDMNGGCFKTINRTDANTLVNTTGSSTLLSQASTSQVVTSAAQWIFRSTTTYGDMEMGIYCMGAELTSLYSAFNTLINNYMKAMTTSFDSDYQAIINRAVTLGYNLPSAYCQYVQNDMVVKLKSLGVWSKLDILYTFDNDSVDSNFSTLNWKSPSNFQLTVINSPTWTPKLGFTLDGTTQYLNTGWTPSTHAVNWTQDSATMFVRIESPSGSGNFLGTTSGATGLLQFSSANSVASYINSTNPLSTTPSSSTGQSSRAFIRIDSTNINYRSVNTANAQANSARTQTSTGLPTNPVWIGRSGTSYGAARYRNIGLGSALTDAEYFSSQAILMELYGS